MFNTLGVEPVGLGDMEVAFVERAEMRRFVGAGFVPAHAGALEAYIFFNQTLPMQS